MPSTTCNIHSDGIDDSVKSLEKYTEGNITLTTSVTASRVVPLCSTSWATVELIYNFADTDNRASILL